ncbi:MAG TPA: hypothetical protein VFQ36_12765 [Ktedonobacteraceae bacterium]|nr:hypothetical protein [Ktedonobacteraceae bacterium]
MTRAALPLPFVILSEAKDLSSGKVQNRGKQGDREGRLYYDRDSQRSPFLVEATLAVALRIPQCRGLPPPWSLD